MPLMVVVATTVVARFKMLIVLDPRGTDLGKPRNNIIGLFKLSLKIWSNS